MHRSSLLVVSACVSLLLAGCATMDTGIVERRAVPVPRANQQILMGNDGSGIAQSILPRSQVQVNLPQRQQGKIFGPFGAIAVVRIANSGQSDVQISPGMVAAVSGGQIHQAMPHAEFSRIKAEYEENSDDLRTADSILGVIGIVAPQVVSSQYVGVVNAGMTVAQTVVRAKLRSSEDMTASAAAAFEALETVALEEQVLPGREITGGIVVVRDLKPNSAFTLTVDVAGEKHVFSFEPAPMTQ